MKKKTLGSKIYPIAAVAAFAAAIVWLICALQNASGASLSRRQQAIEQNVENAITLCYSVEGEYPETLSRLTENYGVVFDEEKYIVHYSYIAANIRPSVTVIQKAG